jgi:hypothetical protein
MSDETASPWYLFAIKFNSGTSANVQSQRSAFFGSEEFPLNQEISELNGATVKQIGDRVEITSTTIAGTKATLSEDEDGFEGSFTFDSTSSEATPKGKRVTVECQFARASQAAMASAAAPTSLPPVRCAMMDSQAKPWYRFVISYSSKNSGTVNFKEFATVDSKEEPQESPLPGWESSSINEQSDQLIIESADFGEHGFAELTKRGGGFAGQFIFADNGPETLRHGAVEVTCTR